jgi:hypothetical protein
MQQPAHRNSKNQISVLAKRFRELLSKLDFIAYRIKTIAGPNDFVVLTSRSATFGMSFPEVSSQTPR